MGSGDDGYCKRREIGRKTTIYKTNEGDFEGSKYSVKVYGLNGKALVKFDARSLTFPVTGLWVPARIRKGLRPSLEEAHIKERIEQFCKMCIDSPTVWELRCRYYGTPIICGGKSENIIDIPYYQDGTPVTGPPEESQMLILQTLDRIVDSFDGIEWQQGSAKSNKAPRAFVDWFKGTYRMADLTYIWDGEKIAAQTR